MGTGSRSDCQPGSGFRGRERGAEKTAEFSAHIAQSVEHFLGKEEVTGSNPVVGSMVADRAPW